MLTEAIAGHQLFLTGAIAIARAIHSLAVVVSPFAAMVSPHALTLQAIFFGQLTLQHNAYLTFYEQYTTLLDICQYLLDKKN